MFSSYQKSYIVKSHSSVKRCKCVNIIVNISYRNHVLLLTLPVTALVVFAPRFVLFGLPMLPAFHSVLIR